MKTKSSERTGKGPALPDAHPLFALAHRIESAGGRLLVVGGWVRDQWLGLASKDLDLEVLGLDEAQLDPLLADEQPTAPVGRVFPIRILPRLQAEIAAAPQGTDSFAQAARRRDLTVNAMGWDPLRGETLDPFGGLADLEARVLRATDDEGFASDRLRVLRVAQLHARLGFEPVPALTALCREIDGDGLPGERVFEEFRKLFLRAERPARALRWLQGIGWLRYFPELAALVDVPQDPVWHPEGCVWTHTCMVVDEAAGLRTGDDSEDLALLWAALCHDLGKPATTREERGRIRSLAHDQEGEAPTRALLERLRAPGLLIEKVVLLVRHHLAPALFNKGDAPAGARAYRRLARDLGRHEVSMTLLERVARADHFGRTTEDALARHFPAGEAFLARAREAAVAHAPPPEVVRGRDLLARGFAPGPRLGILLDRCREIADETGWQEVDRILDRLLEEVTP